MAVLEKSPCDGIVCGMVKKTFLAAFAAVALAADADVAVISKSPRSVTMSNAAVSATFATGDGKLTSLRSEKTGELLGNGGMGYFDLTTMEPEANHGMGGSEFRVVRDEGSLAELSFTKKTEGAELDLHYVLLAGEPGIYVFAIHRHTAAMAPQTVAQKRYVLRADPNLFTYAVVSGGRHGPLPPPSALRSGGILQDATFRLADGRVYTKYDWADFSDTHWGHGLCGKNTGLWMIFGSTEYFSGGPTKQELTVHQTDTTPVELAMFTGEHFLGKTSLQNVEGDWARLYGPVFLYVNGGATPQEMYADAAARAAKLAASWPYAWMENPLYPRDRGAVSGTLKIGGGHSASNATVILAAPEPDWQVQWKEPVFWTHADASGAFTLPRVKPGSYSLYSFVPGVIGEFRRDKTEVKAGATNELGTLDWIPESHGKTVWQIGTPDRMAGEFRHGGETRHYGLLNSYAAEFSNDVNFVIGKSRERDDWNFVQPVFRSPRERKIGTTWNIHFTMTNAPNGKAVISIATAGSDMSPSLGVLVNEKQVATIRLDDDAGIRRSATLAGQYHLYVVSFDAALLREGGNVIALRLTNRGPWGAVMYDCLRLELEE